MTRSQPSGLRPSQVVEIIGTRTGGSLAFGSGYQIGPTLVLTAAHVVSNTNSIEVRFSCDRNSPVSIAGAVVWQGEVVDLALLELAENQEQEHSVYRPHLGDLQALLTPFVPFRAVGFPAHKATKGAAGRLIRDTDDVSGEIPPLANSKTAMLELRPDSRVAAAGKDWSGFSGSAVFAHDRLVGIATIANRTSTISAIRLASVLEQHPNSYLQEKESAGSTAQFRRLLEVHGLDVTCVPARRRVDYADYVVWLANRCEQLRDRDENLAELAAFTHSARPYEWYKADPWAGKTALAAEFAANPPDDVDVVCYFFSRQREEYRIRQFIAELCSQLSALVGRNAPAVSGHASFCALWLLAARQAEATGRRLLLLVDGVDESEEPGRLMGLLPSDCLPLTHVLILSRRNVSVTMLASGHPIYEIERCRQRALAPSPHAQVRKEAATAELDECLQDEKALLVLSALAAAVTLTINEAVELVRRHAPSISQYHVKGVLERTAARVVEPIAGSDGPRYAYQHETLRRATLEAVGEEQINSIHSALHIWAEELAEAHWPPDTPDYFVIGYPTLLSDLQEAQRLAELPSSHRTNFLGARTGNDSSALREIDMAISACACAREPMLDEAVLLAVRQEQLLGALDISPIELVEGWISLKNWQRGLLIAKSIEDRGNREKAIASVVVAAAEGGEIEEARSLLYLIGQADRRADALSRVLRGQPETPPERVHELLKLATEAARQVSDPFSRIASYADLIVAASSHPALITELTTLLQNATSAVPVYDSPSRRDSAYASLAVAAGHVGNLTLAMDLAMRIGNVQERARAFIGAATGVSERNLAPGQLIEYAEESATKLTPAKQAEVLLSAASINGLAKEKVVGLAAQVERIAANLKDPYRGAILLAGVARLGTPEWSIDRIAVAQQLARNLPSLPRVRVLCALAETSHLAGHSGVVTRLLNDAFLSIEQEASVAHRDRFARRIAEASVAVGAIDMIERCVEHLADATERAILLGTASSLAMDAGVKDRGGALCAAALALAEGIPDPFSRARSLALLAARGRLRRPDLLHDAEEAVKSVNNSGWRWNALEALALYWAEQGSLSEVELVLDALHSGDRRLALLARIAGQLGSAQAVSWWVAKLQRSTSQVGADAIADGLRSAIRFGQVEEALALLSWLPESAGGRTHFTSKIVERLATDGQFDRAADLVQSVSDPIQREELISRIVIEAAKADHLELARKLSGKIRTAQLQERSAAALASAVARSNDQTNAVLMAKAIPTNAIRSAALIDIACIFFNRSPDLAMSVFSEAIRDARKTDDSRGGVSDLQQMFEQMQDTAGVDFVLEASLTLSRISEEYARLVEAIGRRALKAGSLDDGLKAMARLPEPISTGYLLDSSRVALREHNFKAAAELAARVRQGRKDRLINILQTSASAGPDDEALQVAEILSRVEGESAVAAAVATLGREPGRFGLAHRIADGIRAVGVREEAFSSLAVFAADEGRLDMMVLLIQRISEPQRSRVLNDCGTSCARRGDLGGVLALAQATRTPTSRVKLVAAAAEEAAGRGHIDIAGAILRTQMDEVMEMADLVERLEVAAVNVLFAALKGGRASREDLRGLSTLVEPLAALGSDQGENVNQIAMSAPAVSHVLDTSLMRSLAGLADGSSVAAEKSAMRQVVVAAAMAGRVSLARAVAAAAPDVLGQSEMLGEIVNVLAERGSLAEAIGVARRIPIAQAQTRALGSIAAAGLSKGDLDVAILAARGIPAAADRSTVLDQVAQRAIAVGQVELAVTCLGIEGDPGVHFCRLGDMLISAIAQGDGWVIDNLVQVASRILLDGSRGPGAVDRMVDLMTKADLSVDNGGARLVIHLFRSRLSSELCVAAVIGRPGVATTIVTALASSDQARN